MFNSCIISDEDINPFLQLFSILKKQFYILNRTQSEYWFNSLILTTLLLYSCIIFAVQDDDVEVITTEATELLIPYGDALICDQNEACIEDAEVILDVVSQELMLAILNPQSPHPQHWSALACQ